MLALRRLCVAQRAALAGCNKKHQLQVALNLQRGLASRGKFGGGGGNGRRRHDFDDMDDDEDRRRRRGRNVWKELEQGDEDDPKNFFGGEPDDLDDEDFDLEGLEDNYDEAPEDDEEDDDFLNAYPSSLYGSVQQADSHRKLFNHLVTDEDGKEFLNEIHPQHAGDFTWQVPEELMDDKSWPDTSGTNLYMDLFNIPDQPPNEEETQKILKEFYRRVGHKPLNEIKLPTLNVTIPDDHPDKEALELMKLSLENNGRIKMDDKEEIMTMLIDEIDWLRNDKTPLFQE